MKKVLKIIVIVFACFFVIGVVVNVVLNSKDTDSFKEYVNEANRNCPICFANGTGQITSISLVHDMLVYKMNMPSDLFDIAKRRQKPELMKKVMIMSFLCLNGQGDNNGDALFSWLVKEKCGIRFEIITSNNDRFDYESSYHELLQMRKQYQLNPQEAMKEAVILKLAMEQATLPFVIEEGMVLTSIELVGTNIVMVITIDENTYSMEYFSQNKETIKEAIWESALTDPSNKATFDLCKISHSGFIYRLVGIPSFQTIDIVISPEEIQKNITTPSNLNIY